MTELEILSELESLGTEQNRKTYRRHGVSDPMYGVSYANLEKLRKRIKTDHTLATSLWESGNHDARILATMIADPKQATDRFIDSWMKDSTNSALSYALAKYVSHTDLSRKKMEKWVKSKDEWTGHAGWLLFAYLARSDKETSNDFFESYIEIIERSIHSAKNMVKDSMNSALISIGIRNSSLEKKAVAAARRIGKVEVDHGDTSCKTPDAVEYIFKAVKRRQ